MRGPVGVGRTSWLIRWLPVLFSGILAAGCTLEPVGVSPANASPIGGAETPVMTAAGQPAGSSAAVAPRWPERWLVELPGLRITGPATIACRADGRVFIGTYGVLPDGYDGPLVLEAVREPPQLLDTGYRSDVARQLTVEGEALSQCGLDRGAILQPLPPGGLRLEALP